MNKYRLAFLFITLAILLILLSACAGGALTTTSWPGVTADEETAYVAFGAGVYAIDLSNGALRWRFPQEPDNQITFYSEPALTADQQLLVGGYNNTLYSLNPQNGQQNWAFTQGMDRYIGGVLATEEYLYAPNADYNLYTLDNTGALEHTFTTQEALWAKPSINGNRVYLSSMDHSLYALDAQTSQPVWEQNLSGALVGIPTLSEDGKVYVGTFGKEMVALDADTGELLWEADTEGWVWSGPALYEDRLYFGDVEGNLYALDRNTGSNIWNIQPDGPIVGTPLVTDEAIYFTTETGSLVSITHEGTPKWTQSPGGKIYPSPVAAGDLILVAPIGIDPLLIAYDQNGGQRWTFTPEG